MHPLLSSRQLASLVMHIFFSSHSTILSRRLPEWDRFQKIPEVLPSQIYRKISMCCQIKMSAALFPSKAQNVIPKDESCFCQRSRHQQTVNRIFKKCSLSLQNRKKEYVFNKESISNSSILMQMYQLQQFQQISKTAAKMKTNFDINLPTIPGKSIKFKIQDIKSKAFGAQAARFKDNKGLLTKKFIQSFSNFHQTNLVAFEDDRETEAESYMSQSRQPMNNSPMQFHLVIPDQKKHLINLQQRLLREQLSQPQEQFSYLSQKGQAILKSRVKGFSFDRAPKQVTNKNGDQNNQQYELTDNYYFTKDRREAEQSKSNEQNQNKKLRKNAVFKAESRKEVYDRLEKSIVPGPGAYFSNLNTKNKNTHKVKRIMSVSRRKQQNFEDKKDVNYRKIKQIISKVMNEGRKTSPNEQQKQTEQEKAQKNQHMFIVDDRDRFGNQLYPIAPKLKTPGPGHYNAMPQTIESKAKKVQVVEQQRKLLKQWFNN